MTPAPAVDIRPADGRFHTRLPWLDSRHAFSFGRHHDPDEIGHGLLIVANDDVVAPGGGFGTHTHRDMEIVTWVLDGRLAHRDSAGNEGVIHPGLAQRMSAGTGIAHSEMNASPDEPVHFLQMWVVPERAGLEPGYEQRDLTTALEGGDLVAVASGRGHPGAVSINQPGAVMWVARPGPGATIDLPDAPYVHLQVARGEVVVDGHHLGAGDSARLTAAGPVTVTVPDAGGAAGAQAADVRAADAGPADGGTEIVVWESDAAAVR